MSVSVSRLSAKIFTLGIIVLGCCTAAHAQLKKDDNQIFTAVQHSASYKGGVTAFYNYLAKTIRYPAIARENNVQGRVIATFVVEKNGALSDIKVLRGIGSGCDEEAVNVLKASPKWNPGTQNGIKVRQQYTVPISFTLAYK